MCMYERWHELLLVFQGVHCAPCIPAALQGSPRDREKRDRERSQLADLGALLIAMCTRCDVLTSWHVLWRSDCFMSVPGSDCFPSVPVWGHPDPHPHPHPRPRPRPASPQWART